MVEYAIIIYYWNKEYGGGIASMDEFYVKHTWRRKGIGTSFIDHIATVKAGWLKGLQDADMKKPLSRWAWGLWSYQWKPVKEDKYTIKVRGFDRSGKVQESEALKGHLFRSSAFPGGAKGIHSASVTVHKP